MTNEEIDAIAKRESYCAPFETRVSLTGAERDQLVALARIALDPCIREAIEATFEQRPGYMKLIAAAVRALPDVAKEEA